MSDFLQDDYEVPSASSGYMKFQTGDNTFRILSKPIIGWEYWNLEGKPIRIEGVEQPKVDQKLIKPEKDGKRNLKHFWAMIVWNHEKGEINILEITQSSIQKAIKNHVKDDAWGAPYDYDFKVTKSEKNGKTEYAIMARPKAKITSEIIAAFNERQIDLHALLEGKNPFQDVVNVTPLELSL